MNKNLGITLGIALALGFIAVLMLITRGHTIALLNPQGPVAQSQFNILVVVTLLMLIVVIPVFVMTFAIAWKYRATNTKAKYTPEFDHHTVAEFTWWAIPIVLIGIISVITWKSSHDLDPSQPLASSVRPVTVQVVALQWKWLFIYPELGIASVNEVRFPVGTPVNFQITSDAPMNSFWIPQLGGQIYAMAGMSTQLHLLADHPGTYAGASANISGEGFAGMTFAAKATSQADFDAWVGSAQDSSDVLTLDAYSELAKPSMSGPVTAYALGQKDLYDRVVMKYMAPTEHLMDTTNVYGPHGCVLTQAGEAC